MLYEARLSFKISLNGVGNSIMENVVIYVSEKANKIGVAIKHAVVK